MPATLSDYNGWLPTNNCPEPSNDRLILMRVYLIWRNSSNYAHTPPSWLIMINEEGQVADDELQHLPGSEQIAAPFNQPSSGSTPIRSVKLCFDFGPLGFPSERTARNRLDFWLIQALIRINVAREGVFWCVWKWSLGSILINVWHIQFLCWIVVVPLEPSTMLIKLCVLKLKTELILLQKKKISQVSSRKMPIKLTQEQIFEQISKNQSLLFSIWLSEKNVEEWKPWGLANALFGLLFVGRRACVTYSIICAKKNNLFLK